MSLKGKVFAITGAASGIGLATAHLLASRGASLSLADMQEAVLRDVAADISSKYQVEALPFTVDVRKAASVDAWIADTVAKLGHLSGAANLAGVIGKSIGLRGLKDLEEEEWEFIIGVNLTGVMHCMRAQLQNIEEGGSIVNAASIAGLMGRANNAAYAASKHGVVGLTRSAAKEEGNRGVRVNCIAPGRIETPMTTASLVTDTGAAAKETDSLVALGRVGKVEEAASLIAFLLGDESTYITGAAYSVDGGWHC
jgi:NAD(P)-dependent dehydrogenase (short-subunit alcohol dehydrogenase family)